MPPKNAPRFLDYRQRKLPLDVALSFGRPPIDNYTNNCNARDLILSGRVLVNNITERSCHRLVDRFDDAISVIDDTSATVPISVIDKPKYFICYKPRGVVCSRRRNEGIDREESVLISDWLAQVFHQAQNHYNHHHATIKTVGRLDEESEGMLLLTNDGSFNRLLCDPEFGLMKTYRVVVRGCGYNNLLAEATEQQNIQNANGDCVSNEKEEVAHEHIMKKRVSERIERANNLPTVTTDINGKETVHHFPFESCNVLDVGKLSSQHSSDDSYYALIDLVLCEGKRHAVRRICKNSQLRVCYLSRISVEGLLDDGQYYYYYDVVKPETIAGAHSNGFIPGGRHRDVVLNGELIPRSDHNDNNMMTTLMHSGQVVELRDCDVDRIFALRDSKTRINWSS
eukprot:scaffold312_cov145-Skeletonema_menzelii.AAC.4